MAGLSPEDYDRTLRVVNLALRDAIGAHGPIGKRHANNAARLIAHALTSPVPVRSQRPAGDRPV